MKRNLLKIAAVGLLAAGMAFGQTTTATTQGAGKGKAVKALLQRRMMKALNLTDAQKQQAKTIRQSARQTAQPLVQQLQQNRQALRAAVQAGDSVKIQQLSIDSGNLQGHILAIRSDAMAKINALLTPEQKAQETEFRQKAKDLLGKKAAQRAGK
jgi:Spy/CpxP family protein refolding chaperone